MPFLIATKIKLSNYTIFFKIKYLELKFSYSSLHIVLDWFDNNFMELFLKS